MIKIGSGSISLLRLFFIGILAIQLAIALPVLLAPRLNAGMMILADGVRFGCFVAGAKGADCIETSFKRLADTKGPEAAMHVLKNDQPIFFGSALDCHASAHAIGRVAASRYASVGEAFAAGDPYCWSGYYHGVIEGTMRGIPRETIGARELDQICVTIRERDRATFDHWNCAHGLGHALMYLHGEDLERSLASCDLLSDPWERTQCPFGVYMQNAMGGETTAHQSRFLSDDPAFPCSEATPERADTCWWIQSTRYLHLTPNDFGGLFAFCDRAGEHRAACLDGIGREASARSGMHSSKTAARCTRAPNDGDHAACIAGAARNMRSFYHDDAPARAFCTDIDAKFADTCLAAVDAYPTVLYDFKK